MKVLIQWTTRTPRGWDQIDSRAWNHLPKKPLPDGTETVDDGEGWVFALNVQGIVFSGDDHYAVEDIPDGVVVTTWNDDPEDWPVGTRNAMRWTLLTPAPDPRFGGAINTRQSRIVWADDLALFPDARPFEEFIPPDPAVTKHGVWVRPEPLFRALNRNQKARGWREWIE